MIRSFQPADTEAVVALWEQTDLVRPWNDPRQELARKVAHDGENVLVAEDEGRVVGTVMVGFEGHRGWINYLAVSPGVQRHGWGRALVTEAERRLVARGCPKVNLQVRHGNTDAVEFYTALGYRVDDVLSMGKRLDAVQSGGKPQSSAITP